MNGWILYTFKNIVSSLFKHCVANVISSLFQLVIKLFIHVHTLQFLFLIFVRLCSCVHVNFELLSRKYNTYSVFYFQDWRLEKLLNISREEDYYVGGECHKSSRVLSCELLEKSRSYFFLWNGWFNKVTLLFPLWATTSGSEQRLHVNLSIFLEWFSMDFILLQLCWKTMSCDEDFQSKRVEFW